MHRWPNTPRRAQEAGLFGVRRHIAEQDEPIFDEVMEAVWSPFSHMGRAFRPSSLHATVVAFRRYNMSARHITEYPATREVAEQIPSTRRPIQATLGRFMMAGGRKLAVQIDSPGLLQEEVDFSNVYQENNFPLRPDRWSNNGNMTPHLSLAAIYVEHVGRIDDYALERMNRQAQVEGMPITLLPPKIDGQQHD
jgi:hypothetical protein